MDPFLGQMALVPYTFAPNGWYFAQGQLLAVSANTGLFSLLGTYFGGNGISNFALPDLRGRVPVGVGLPPGRQPIDLGQMEGTETITLNGNQLPGHNHLMATGEIGRGQQPVSSPANAFFATAGVEFFGAPTNVNQSLAVAALAPSGGKWQPHDNMMPFLVLNWIIAYNGIFPNRS